MRVLCVSNFYPPARSYGYTQWCYEVTEALRARGHEVSILTSRYERGRAGESEEGVYRLLHLQTRDLLRYRPLHFFLRHRREERENHAGLEFAVRDAYLDQAEGGSWTAVRLNFGVFDRDSKGELTTLKWQVPFGKGALGTGTFRR